MIVSKVFFLLSLSLGCVGLSGFHFICRHWTSSPCRHLRPSHFTRTDLLRVLSSTDDTAAESGALSSSSGTAAQPTSEIIDPTKYLSDLYGILGVNRNASRTELKTAYWEIASKNHPDRNNSVEALQLFRNASHAYNILARDRQLRAEYDAKLNAQDYLNVFEEVSSGVLAPLAFDVALPLINMTVKSIGSLGSFAVPLIQDAIEQSSVLVKTALEEDSEVPIDDRLLRATNAVQMLKVEQSVKRLRATEKDCVRKIQSTLDSIEAAAARNETLVTSLQSLNETQNELLKDVRELEVRLEYSKNNLERAEETERRIADNVLAGTTAAEALSQSSEDYLILVTQADARIIELEEELKSLRRGRNKAWDAHLQSLEELKPLEQKNSALRGILAKEQQEKDIRKESFQKVLSSTQAAQEKVDLNGIELQKIEAEQARNEKYQLDLQMKLEKLQQRKISLGKKIEVFTLRSESDFDSGSVDPVTTTLNGTEMRVTAAVSSMSRNNDTSSAATMSTSSSNVGMGGGVGVSSSNTGSIIIDGASSAVDIMNTVDSFDRVDSFSYVGALNTTEISNDGTGSSNNDANNDSLDGSQSKRRRWWPSI